MKVCKQCGFENPDVQLVCMQCDGGLELTVVQAQVEREKALRLTDATIHDDEEELRDSWLEAMGHRFDWIWEIGDKIKYYTFQVQSGLIVLSIIGAIVMFSWIFSSLGL